MANMNLSTALQFFVKGAKDKALQDAFHGAAEQSRQVRNQVQDETERRQQLQMVADNLVTNLGALGVAPGQAQQAAKQFEPYRPASIAEGVTKGIFDEDPATLQKTIQTAGILGQLQGQKKRPIPVAVADKLTEIQTTKDEFALILKEAIEDPSLTGPISGVTSYVSGKRSKRAKVAARLGRLFAKYRKEMSGTAVSERELEELESNLPNMDDRDDTFQEKTKDFIAQMTRLNEKAIGNYEKIGFDLSGFRTTSPGNPVTGATTGAHPSNHISFQTVR